jgi:hypothetical protein
MQPIAHSNATLHDLRKLLLQLDDAKYVQPIQLLSGNTIGMHVRHIIEFYQCLLFNYDTAFVNYDARKRDYTIETNVEHSIVMLDKIVSLCLQLNADKPMILKIQLSDDNEAVEANTTYFREIIYNIEHTIHHLAILKIAIISTFPKVQLHKNFGVAASTIQYQQSVCAQ